MATCPVCLLPVETDSVWTWPCLHSAHLDCVHTSPYIVSDPCPFCRTEAYPMAMTMYSAAFPGVYRRPEESAEETVEEWRSWMNFVPLCCPRMLFADGQFFQDRTDRRMRYTGTRGMDHSWTCLSCMREVFQSAIDVPPMDMVTWLPPLLCQEHGLMRLVVDCAEQLPPGIRGRRWFACCTFEPDDVPMIVQDGACLSRVILVDHMIAGGRWMRTVDEAIVISDDDLDNEIDQVQAILNTYDTAEEEIIMESIVENLDSHRDLDLSTS